MKKIVVASDHAGYHMKMDIIEYLTDLGYHVDDQGCYSDQPCDYADFAHPVAYAVEQDEDIIGVVFCGSGNGINMTVNKHKGIRSAICWNKELSHLARSHNDANICSIPARFVSSSDAKEIVSVFLNTAFEGGRHIARIRKIPL
ncbi:MAG: RpiB/LacA/LacB family sugar-phosphate isomerase [Marinilabiliales bacterium]|nr:RpiB/LacA/LacB family sugar-phosphate isomerase [Marinilabiliales bacterium]